MGAHPEHLRPACLPHTSADTLVITPNRPLASKRLHICCLLVPLLMFLSHARLCSAAPVSWRPSQGEDTNNTTAVSWTLEEDGGGTASAVSSNPAPGPLTAASLPSAPRWVRSGQPAAQDPTTTTEDTTGEPEDEITGLNVAQVNATQEEEAVVGHQVSRDESNATRSQIGNISENSLGVIVTGRDKDIPPLEYDTPHEKLEESSEPNTWSSEVSDKIVEVTTSQDSPIVLSGIETQTSEYPKSPSSIDDVTTDIIINVSQESKGLPKVFTVSLHTQSTSPPKDVTPPEVTTTPEVPQQPDIINPSAWHSSPAPQHGDDNSRVGVDDGDDATSRLLLTTMLIVARTSQKTPLTTPWPGLIANDGGLDDDSSDFRNVTSDLQFELKDLILAVCGTAASTFTLCMLVTFTRCCCKKQKDDSDGDDDAARRGAPTASSSTASHRGPKSLWKRSWKRPLDSGATSATQESSASENVTQVTIERRESYTDDHDSDLSEAYDDEDDEGGFTKGRRRTRHGVNGKG